MNTHAIREHLKWFLGIVLQRAESADQSSLLALGRKLYAMVLLVKVEVLVHIVRKRTKEM
eukprot:5061517-Amphidinium_carterae.2